MLDVSSSTVSLFGQNAGRPTTHSAPVTAPARLPEPADHRDRDDVERVVDAEEAFASSRS